MTLFHKVAQTNVFGCLQGWAPGEDKVANAVFAQLERDIARLLKVSSSNRVTKLGMRLRMKMEMLLSNAFLFGRRMSKKFPIGGQPA